MAFTPKIVSKTESSVKITWSHLTNQKVFLEIQDDFNQWHPIYSGDKTEFEIRKLSPLSCYSLKLKFEDSDWIYFKIATEGTFRIFHLTKAISSSNVPLIRKIIQQENLLECHNSDHKTPLVQAVEIGNPLIVTLLITLGAKVNNTLLYTKRTPLMVAVYKGHLEVAKVLINKGSNLLDKDINGLNILHFAVDSNKMDCVEFVCSLSKELVNVQDCCGWTPLLRAVILQCSSEIIKFLLKNGADRTICDKKGFDFEKHCQIINSQDKDLNKKRFGSKENNLLFLKNEYK